MLLEDILDELKWFVIMFIAVTVSLCIGFAAINGFCTYVDKKTITDIPQSRDGRWQKS